MSTSWQLRYIEPGSDEFERAKELRYRELYAQWGLPRALVEDTDGRTYRQLAAFDGDRVVGFGRIHLDGGASQIFQLCVAGDRRCEGVATELMNELIALARSEGRAEVTLDARDTAIAFYERLGFIAEGETFLSSRTNTPHRSMRLVLR